MDTIFSFLATISVLLIALIPLLPLFFPRFFQKHPHLILTDKQIEDLKKLGLIE